MSRTLENLMKLQDERKKAAARQQKAPHNLAFRSMVADLDRQIAAAMKEAGMVEP